MFDRRFGTVILLSASYLICGCRSGSEDSSPPAAASSKSSQNAEDRAQVTPAAEPPYSPVFTTGEEYYDEKGLLHVRVGPEYAPAPLDGVVFDESEPGPPQVIGCADGQREAFSDVKKFPNIAGCLGRFLVAPLDDAPTGIPCGDDLGNLCDRPANVCSAGWHVCGTTDEGEDELIALITADECDNAGPGRFNAGISHTGWHDIDPCFEEANKDWKNAPKLSCMPEGRGGEPVCCGSMCEFGICKDGVWPGRTRISRGVAQGCTSVTSKRNPGVLCCRDRLQSRPPD